VTLAPEFRPLSPGLTSGDGQPPRDLEGCTPDERFTQLTAKFRAESARAACSRFDELKAADWARATTVPLRVVFRGLERAANHALTHSEAFDSFAYAERFIEQARAEWTESIRPSRHLNIDPLTWLRRRRR